jgi:4a-hydroxytetrahydrobiopterin dehydratase
MPPDEARRLAVEVPDWTVGELALTRELKFKDFKAAMAFVVRVADVAEGEGHHPDIHVSWNRVRLELTTHKIGGLSTNDFVVAAKIDRVLAS